MIPNALARASAWLVLFILCLFSLSFFHLPGTNDVGSYWMVWMRQMEAAGLREGYVLARSDYPPLSFVVLHLVRLGGEALGWDGFAALKATLLGFALVSAALLLLLSGSTMLAAAFVASLLVSGMALGYLDLFLVPALLGMVWALQRDRPVLGAGLFCLACLTKWQPLVIAPFLAIHIFRIGSPTPRALLGVLRDRTFWWVAALVAGLGAALLAGFGLAPLGALQLAMRNNFFSGNGLNLPWIEQFVWRILIEGSAALNSPATFLTNAGPWAVRVQKGLFLLGYAATVFWAMRAEKTLANMLLFSITGFLTYITLNTGVHENHLFVPMVLGFALAAVSRGPDSGVIAALLAVMCNVNLLLFYRVTGDTVDWRVVGMDLSIPMAATFVLVWVVFMVGAARRFAPLPLPQQRPAAGGGPAFRLDALRRGPAE